MGMTNIRDLHFNEEVLPLFDFTGNEGAKETLVSLLSDFPIAVEEITCRQDILKSLIREEDLFVPISYPRSEFNEVYRYTKDISNRGGLDGPSLQIQLLFAGKERNWEKARLSQLFFFLHRIRQSWFSRIKPGLFPDEFAARLRKINRLFVELDVEKYQAIARERKFHLSETVRLIRLLAEKSRNGEMDMFWKDFFLFEAYLSIARGIRQQGLIFPSFTDGRGIGLAAGSNALVIEQFYHPLLKNPVKNSLISRGSVTLITGPNMSGKSTLLKSVGLCVVLAHLGLAVPAEKCELPFFDELSIAINLHDQLQSGYSHFMTEIHSLKNVVVAAAAGRRCFALFDELFRGTNAEDALAISATTIIGLSGFPDSHFFISTHLHQLKEMIDWKRTRISTRHLGCVLEGNKPVFTYQLKEGWSDLRIGQILFEQEGLNKMLARR